MRICLYVGKAAPPEKQDEWLANARSTCDVYASNLHREFTARGHEVVFASSLSARPNDVPDDVAAKRVARYEKMAFPEADHAICLEQNGWRFREPMFFEKARAATKGLICAICDHDNLVDGPQDFLFTARRPVHPSRARYAGWAADPDIFKPEKDPEWLTIFVDHKYHAAKKADNTEALLKSATSFAARLAADGRRVGRPPRKVQVVFFSPDGIERIEPGDVRDVDLGNDRRAFYRRVPGPELAAWTRRTDIFVVTHGESMGLPVLENAMAGALIVARSGFVKPELLRSLAHSEYTSVDHINWESLVDQLDPERFRRRALHFSWGRLAQRMIETFEGHSQPPREAPRRLGNLLVASPAVVADPRFARLATWRAKNAVVEHRDQSDAIIARPGPSHYLRRDLSKNPWPETYALSFTVRPNGRDNLAVIFCGERDEERAEVRFDFNSAENPSGRTTNGWAVLETTMLPIGEEILCQVVVHSDWAPVLRCYLLLTRGDALEFEPDDQEPGLEIRRVQLASGLAFIAEAPDDAGQIEAVRTAAAG